MVLGHDPLGAPEHHGHQRYAGLGGQPHGAGLDLLDLERQMSADIMRGGNVPQVRRLKAGQALTRQGEPGDELFLVLDGVVSVDVDGTVLGEVGPGAVLGERALLEGGTRTSTLTAVTPVRVAAAPGDTVDLDALRELSQSHHREDA